MSENTFAIVQLALSNVQGLIATSVNFPAGTTEVVIGGKNGSGKSSHLKGIEWLLTGLTSGSGEFIRQPKDGEVSALTASGSMTIKGQNGQTYTITREKSDLGTRLSIKSSDGGSQPAEFLKGLLGPGGFINLNPFALADMQPAKRKEAFKKAFGLDFTELDKEDEELKNEAKLLEAQADGIQAYFKGIPDHTDVPAEEVSSSAILKQIEECNEHNRGKQSLLLQSQSLKADFDRISTQISEDGKEILRLQELIDTLRQRVTDQLLVSDNKSVELEKLDEEIKNYQVKDTTELQAQLEAVEDINQKVRENKSRADNRAKFAELEEQRVAKNKRRDEIKAEKLAMIKAIKFPVDGLEFGDNDIMFRKPGQEPIPFDCLSSAEKLKVGTALGLQSSGPLKVVLTEDADRYDDDSRKIVYDMVKEAGGMLFLEMVRPSGGDFTLIIEEGKVKDAVQSQGEPL